MKKYPATQELVNIYPSWSRVRTDDQSAGHQLLNAQAAPMDRMDKRLSTSRANTYLLSANLDEIDITHRIVLPTTFVFNVDNLDPTSPTPLPPTVVGNPGIDDFSVGLAFCNTLEEFWYKSVPNRFSLGRTAIQNHNLLSLLAGASPLTVELNHHIEGGGEIWIEATGGTQFLTVEDGEVRRGTVIIRGKTRKDTSESETFIFPWDMKQKSERDWKTIEKVEVFDVQSGVQLDIRSADFNAGPYLDHYNLRYSENRRKIDTFWDIGTVAGHTTLDKVHYVSDEWENLAIGFPEKNVTESWELLDENDINITGIDIAVQPFSDKAWVLSSSGKIHLYDMQEEMVTGVDLLKEKTYGSHVQFEYDSRYLVKDEVFTFTPWHARPLKEILDYSIWYQTPSGTKFGLLDGAAVPFTSNFKVKGQQLLRVIADDISVSLTERGEYLFNLEATFIDKEVHIEKIIVNTNFKKPLVTLDLEAQIPFLFSGLDYDSDQKLWVTTTSGYQEINLHTDQMLIDYDQKLIYFKEQYDNVSVTTTV